MVRLSQMRLLHLLLLAVNLASSSLHPALVVCTLKVDLQTAQIDEGHLGKHVRVQLFHNPVHDIRVHTVVQTAFNEVRVREHEVQTTAVFVDDPHHYEGNLANYKKRLSLIYLHDF